MTSRLTCDPKTTTSNEEKLPMSTCDRCKANASQLWAINDGPALCATCKETIEREQREKADEPRRLRIEAEMKKFIAQQRVDALRAPRPQYLCEIHSDHGPAVVLANGSLLCRGCSEIQYPDDPSWRPALVLLLEARVAALEAALAAQQPSAKPARKGGAQ
jgi:hypothetical protein